MAVVGDDGFTGLGSLHDLALVDIRLRWRAAEAHLEFADHNGAVLRIGIAGLKLFELTRALPWGESPLVNEATLTRLEGGEYRLVLEMQSGDSVTVVGSHADYAGSRSNVPDPSALPLG